MKLTKRSQEEIATKIREVGKSDFFGAQTSDLLEYLSFENAKQFLKSDVTPEQWGEIVGELKSPEWKIKDYMPFAWEKANNFRGLSAVRSLNHMSAWLWLDGKDDFIKTIDFEDYEFYGKDILVKICELYGIDYKKWDDGVRLNQEPGYNE